MVGQLSWSTCDRDAWNTASFSLSNAGDNFVLTFDNLGINPLTYKTGGNNKWRVEPGSATQINMLNGYEDIHEEIG